MDSGQWLKSGFYLEPALNGSFVLYERNPDAGIRGQTIAFSNINDLIEFMKSERKGLLSGEQSATDE